MRWPYQLVQNYPQERLWASLHRGRFKRAGIVATTAALAVIRTVHDFNRDLEDQYRRLLGAQAYESLRLSLQAIFRRDDLQPRIHRPEMGPGWYRFASCAIEPGPMRAHGGFMIQPDNGPELLGQADIIVIPGWKGAQVPVPEDLCQNVGRRNLAAASRAQVE